MKLGYIGLGRMGFSMVELLLEKKHQVVVYDRNPAKVHTLSKKGAEAADSLQQMVRALPAPRLLWLMVPYQAVDSVLQELLPNLAKGDTVVDGGNSPYKYSIRRAEELKGRGIDFLDAGVSGGPSGARSGACIMVGGSEESFRKLESLFRDLSAEGGLLHVGAAGAGHFVKMVHNGIEYGMMQALAEGFSIMKAAPFGLDLRKIADLYNHRSVIESRLIEWLKDAYERSGAELHGISGSAEQSGEGMWTVEAARELGTPVPAIKAALDFRFQSQKTPSYTGKIVSVLRHEFGGHEDRDEAGQASDDREPKQARSA